MDLLKRQTPCNMPVKVVQFGEGNFLRAFIDWMIDEMNRKVGFNGSVQIIQPLDKGLSDMINAQDGLYTLILRGIADGKLVEDTRVIESVKGCLNAYTEWEKAMETFRGADLRFCFSNTTEAGIEYKAEPYTPGVTQTTFPAKVTALLYERFKAGLPGLIFLPCELIDKNGITLKKHMIQYATEWALGADYIDYIENANTFCCTLVDRIVAGYPRATADAICEKLGYKDNLLDCGEPFHFFVIEAPDDVEKELPLREAGLDVVFVKNQAPYRTRKVRFLNGAHTATIPAAYLAGFDFVDEVVADPFFGKYMRTLLFEEVYPTVDLPDDEKTAFASAIVERFANPFAMHRLLSIALNSVSKWEVRVLPSLLDYLKIKGQLPKVLSFSLAALIAFYRNEGGTGLGRVNAYPVADSDGIAAFFEEQWKNNEIPALVRNVLARTDFWDMDLNTVPGLTDNVTANLKNIMADGVRLAAGALF
ncbi:MAG: tagaturonate reductase [Lentisphaerae bacterium]|nr:tagaturonate reductase [Lentisphaerota bacterium]